MGTRVLLFLVVAVVSSGECVQTEPHLYGRVEISAFSIFGDRLTNLAIDLIEEGTQKNLRSEFRDAVATRVPYGTYALRVSAPGFRYVRREIRVNQPEASIRVQLPVAIECGRPGEIGGSVKPAPRNRELWVKAIPVRGTGSAEARVSPGGSFLISELDEGEYLLIVVDGSAILYSGVFLTSSKPVSVDIEKR